MERNKSKHPARRGEVKNKLKKIITFFTCVVLVLSSIFIYTQCRSLDGYSYYTLENNLLIGKTVQENFLDKVVEQERVKLENEGYYIVSMRLDPDVIVKEQIIKKVEANDGDLKSNLIKCIDTEVLLTQLNMEKGQKMVTIISLLLSILAVLFLAMAREPYAITVVFLLLIVKGMLIFKENGR